LSVNVNPLRGSLSAVSTPSATSDRLIMFSK